MNRHPLFHSGWTPEERADHRKGGDPAGSEARILDAVARSAFTNLRAYSNCCRSTLDAVAQHIGPRDEALIRASSTLAGGIAGTGETCGAIVGALMAIGAALRSEDLLDGENDLLARRTAKAMVARFTELFSGTRCYAVQEHIIGWRCDDPTKEEAWLEADGPIGCALVCAEAARDAARLILEARSR